jgi:hypothetical protein
MALLYHHTGTLPPNWGTLTKLVTLYVDFNRLSGPLPPTWSGMAALEELHLTNNAHTGVAGALHG